MIGRLLCRLGAHKWFTIRVGCDEGDMYGVPAAWGTTSCLRKECTRTFQWVGDNH